MSDKQDDQTAEQTTDQHVLSGVFSEARAAIPEPKNDGAYDKAYQYDIRHEIERE
jgi:hypothetical protein